VACAAAGEGTTLAVSRRSGLRPLALTVTPLRCGPSWLVDRTPSALVTVSDPESRLPPAGELLRRLYGLTAAETRVAAGLVDAKGLADLGEKLGVSRATVCTHLQRVYEKTGTHRQGELVRLVVSLGSAGTRDLPDRGSMNRENG
jgi:DNA-binding CsgD family transcriptional regulator